MKTRLLAGAALSALLASLTASHDAQAAGLFFSDRGVRPLGRGGAYVAGADDLGAMWYNPAGLADAGTTLLADFSWLHFTSEYTRRTQVSDSNGTQRVFEYPTVAGTTPVLPLPTIGGSYNFGNERQFTVAFGLMAPYTAIASYPLTFNGQPSPSRYSLVSLDGSALIIGGAWFAWKPADAFRIGAGLEVMAGSFKSTVVFSASPADRLISAPEDPSYDAFSSLNVGPIFAPSANIGATIVPEKSGIVRIGVSAQAPFHVDAPATINVRLPTAPEFDKASQQGTAAHVQFNLPAILRFGVEVRPIKDLRIEATYVREFWSNHQAIDIVPDNVKLLNVTGFPSPFAVSPISLPRGFQDSNSFRLGGEGTLKVSKYLLDLRTGLNYETSAIPSPYVSPLTIDLDKVTWGLGGSIHIGEHWRLDAVYAHVFAFETTVSPSEARVPRVNPVKGNPTQTEAINGGTYKAQADVLGIGARYKF